MAVMKKLFANKIFQTIMAIVLLFVWGALKVYQGETRAQNRADKKMKEDIANSVDEAFKDFKIEPLSGGGK